MDRDDHNRRRHHALTLSLPVLHPPTATTAATPSPSPSPLHLHLPNAPLPTPPPPQVIVALAAATAPPAAEAAASGGGHGREDCWSDGATVALIDAWGDHYRRLDGGNLKQKDWKDVADMVNRRGGSGCSVRRAKTDVQCKNRLDTLKKKYKLEKRKMDGEVYASKWKFFGKLDELIRPSGKGKKQQPQTQIMSDSVSKPFDQQVINAADMPLLSDQVTFFSRNPKGNMHFKEHFCVREGRTSKDSPNLRGLRPTWESRNPSDSADPATSPPLADSIQESLGGSIDSKSAKKRRQEEAEEEDNPLKHLAQAIVKFGEVYERIEIVKQQQLVELEKQRMEFLKDLELQKMQLFMQTQVELAKLKHSYRTGSEHFL